MNRKPNYSNMCNQSDREFHRKTDKERHKRLMRSLTVLHCWASKGPHRAPLVLFIGEIEAGTHPKITLERGKKLTMSAAQMLNPDPENKMM